MCTSWGVVVFFCVGQGARVISLLLFVAGCWLILIQTCQHHEQPEPPEDTD